MYLLGAQINSKNPLDDTHLPLDFAFEVKI